jgi:hypothetical protein
MWEVEVGGSPSEAGPSKSMETVSKKIAKAKRVGGLA